MTISREEIRRVRDICSRADPEWRWGAVVGYPIDNFFSNAEIIALCDAAERGAEVMDSEVSYEIWQDEEWCAEASGEGAIAEALHYASVYGQDGPVEIYMVTRSKLDIAAFAKAYNKTEALALAGSGKT